MTASSGSAFIDIAGVVIGRNEGERLQRCIGSLMGHLGRIVYVDSGSTDGSVDMAKGNGVDVVALDMRFPFTAARARNAGFLEALRTLPKHTYVQFVDGDCEVRPEWLAKARAFLDANPQVAAVCGRRRERYPERTLYNQLCDMEWQVPAGPAKGCGGDGMMRVDALRQVGGYRDDLIAGEEPELCVRLRAKGWSIHVLSAEMTLHDVAMTRFSQWWTRIMRSGYAYAEGVYLHGAPPERHFVRELRSSLLWGLGMPFALVLAFVAFGPWALTLLLIYPLQMMRLFAHASGSWRQRFLRSSFLVVGKFAETQGALRFWRLKSLRRKGTLIEYK